MGDLISKKQIGMILYHLRLNGVKDGPSTYAFLSSLDKFTASNVIDAYMKKNPDIALNQLKHLGIVL